MYQNSTNSTEDAHVHPRPNDCLDPVLIVDGLWSVRDSTIQCLGRNLGTMSHW